MFLLTGKDDSLDSELGMTSAVVLRLVEPLQGRGHHLLFSELRERGFEACGTLWLNRRGVPPEVKVPMSKGENDGMKIVQWHDKRVVLILSTIHGGQDG